LYYLYIDESGDEGDYLDSNGQVIRGSSRYFTAGGIIVKDTDVQVFEREYNNIVTNYFAGIALPLNFKLHYYELRTPHPPSPYNQLSPQQRLEIPQKIFDLIQNLDCSLLSVTIDLASHCNYPHPANPRAYSLLLILERFQYFLEDNNSTGKAIYERFNAKMRKKVEIELRWLRSIPTFPVPTNLNNIQGRVITGDPTKQPILNIADFFTYLPYNFRNTSGQATTDFDYIKSKYYNLYGGWLRTGRVEL
jgi:hypothetical protein